MQNFKVDPAAVARVKNPVPRPSCCSCCGGPVSIVNNKTIYNGKSYGKWPYAYYCASCKAYVGIHPNTDIPLGYMADPDTRKARQLKRKFNDLMRVKFGKDKNKWYAWLASKMSLDASECHWGMFTYEQCLEADRHVQEAAVEHMAKSFNLLKGRLHD